MLENNSADLTIGFDVGGTNVRGGVITRDGEILASRTMPTSGDPRQLDDDLVAIVEELRVDYPVGAVGLAVAECARPEKPRGALGAACPAGARCQLRCLG